jgi:hypothetical protein
MQRVIEQSNISSNGVGIYASGNIEIELDCEVNDDYYTLRDKLIEHFTYLWENGRIVWPNALII